MTGEPRADDVTVTEQGPKQRCPGVLRGEGGTEPSLDEMTKGQKQLKEVKKSKPGRQRSTDKGQGAEHRLGSGAASPRDCALLAHDGRGKWVS